MAKVIDVKKLGKAKVIVDIVKKGNVEIRPGYAMNPRAITVHNTGNPGRGANAEMHNRYIHNMAGKSPRDTGYASWHFSVDDKYIYQHIPLDESAWHCGDGSGTKSGNRTSIGIEICENPETNTHQAEENAIALICYLMKTEKIGVADVVPHQHWSGKYCPRVILKRDGGFTKFRNRVKAAYSAYLTGSAVSKTDDKPAASKPSTAITGATGTITADVWTQSKPSFSAKRRVRVVKKGQKFKVTAKSGDYYKIGKDWVHKKYIKVTGKVSATPASGAIGTITTDVWTQSKPSFSPNRRVRVVRKNQKFTVLEKSGDYYRIGGDWVNKNYIKVTGSVPKAGKTGVVTGDVWLHSKPDFKTSTRVKVLKKGTKWAIEGETNGMYKLGPNAYVSKKYLKV